MHFSYQTVPTPFLTSFLVLKCVLELDEKQLFSTAETSFKRGPALPGDDWNQLGTYLSMPAKI